jgi:hypothetical protein
MIKRIENQLRSSLKRERINQDRLEYHLQMRREFIWDIIDSRLEKHEKNQDEIKIKKQEGK